ncbi:MAG: PmoA family protein, partial [Gemmataceae bacterium]|nr:PmoA family protein [Gemmataceae bacterium]
ESPMRTLPALVLLLALTQTAAADPLKLTITGGKADQTNVVVRFPLPKGADAIGNVVNLSDKTTVPLQVTGAAQSDDPIPAKYGVFVIPQLKAGQTLTGTTGTVNYFVAPPAFKFKSEDGKPTELVFAGTGQSRKVMQFFNLKHDPKEHYYTFKPFHNVYDPAKGEVMLTNTSSKNAKDGQFPHHRGLFFGFNKITYGDKQTADIWHGTDSVYSESVGHLGQEEGEVVGRHRPKINWHGKDGKPFATEEREVAAYATKGGTLIDWSTKLTTELEKVRLDGDPQHAGFHFRAAQEVSKNGKENTYYLRPDGKGKVGDTRNWDAKGKDEKTINLPWDACSFVVADKRYTVLRINHPDNPKDARGSERDYGRFGDYFEYDLTPKTPLKIKYRVWVQEGEMTVEQCHALAAAFVSPPAVKVEAGK